MGLLETPLPPLTPLPSLASLVTAASPEPSAQQPSGDNSSASIVAASDPTQAEPSTSSPASPPSDAGALFQRALAVVDELARRVSDIDAAVIELVRRADASAGAITATARAVEGLSARVVELSGTHNSYANAFANLDSRISGVAAEIAERARRDKADIEGRLADVVKELAGRAVGGIAGNVLPAALHTAVERLEKGLERVARRIGDV